MTNEEIARKYLSDIVSELTPDKQRVKVFDKAMTQARKSERAKVIKYFAKWFESHKDSMLITAYEDYKFILNQLKGEG